MAWRETVHFSQACKIVKPIECGVAIAGAMKSIRVAEGIAAREMASDAFRPQGE
jgi:hypothetical protein